MDVKKLLLLAAIALAISGCLAQPAREGPATVHVTLAISGIPSGHVHEIYAENGTTLFDVLNMTEKIEYKDYGAMGMLVTSINGTAQNEGGNQKYWQFYVDGKLGETGVSAYRIERPQVIEFRYETIDPGLN